MSRERIIERLILAGVFWIEGRWVDELSDSELVILWDVVE